MPKEKKNKLLSDDNLRHAEYYGMQEVFDDLYSRSKRNEIFTSLMDAVLSRENILLAYRNIKTNTGSKTAGTDRAVSAIFINRLHTQRKPRLVKQGRALTKIEQERYGKSAMLRYVAGTREPIYPIGYVQHKPPHSKKRSICSYTTEGRLGLHDNLRVNVPLLIKLMKQPLIGRSVEYADNRISLFSAQWGKCAVTGQDFTSTKDVHCHHITPKNKGGKDNYGNLVLVLDLVHKLIHATNSEIINHYMTVLNLESQQLSKLNKLRQAVRLFEIA